MRFGPNLACYKRYAVDRGLRRRNLDGARPAAGTAALGVTGDARAALGAVGAMHVDELCNGVHLVNNLVWWIDLWIV